MRLGINATVLANARPTGVENVAINLINTMSRCTDALLVWTIDDAQLEPGNNRVFKVLPRANALWRGRTTALRALWDQVVFPRLVKKQRADVVFFPVQEGMLFPPVPQVVLLIDMAPLLSPEGVPLLRKWSYLTRIPLVLANSSAILTISQSVKQQLLQQYKHIDEKKVSVMHLGYDKARFRPMAADTAALARYGLNGIEYLLYLGSISRNKNIHNIIISYSRSMCSDWYLVLAGKVLDLGYRNELISLINELNLAHRVKLIDYVAYEDLPSFYCGASLFVFPSFYEGFGLPVLEAMACGVPVITSNRNSLPEVAGDAALLVDPDDQDQLARAMREVLTDPETGRTLVARGLDRVESFSWEKAARQVLKVCEEVAAGRVPRQHVH